MEAYSAGIVSQSFWFIEFKKVIRLVSEGKNLSEIRAVCIEDNLVGAVNACRAKRTTWYLINRAAALDEREVKLFIQSDVPTQKLLNLIAVLRRDRLFFEFLFEVYREKISLGIPMIEDRDARVFFNNKERQSTVVENWKESTKVHLKQCYFNFMIAANLLNMDGKVRRITPPIMDAALERHMENKGEYHMIKAITGVR